MKPPRVFISYSHDSAEHKEWVLKFATTLRQRGVDAVLDQWDLKPGFDLPHFMETELASCDYAVMVCSERYVAKANGGEPIAIPISALANAGASFIPSPTINPFLPSL